MKSNSSHPIFEYLFLSLSFILLIFYSYVYFVKIPYIGFGFSYNTGIINGVNEVDAGLTIQDDDRILRVASVDWKSYIHDLRHPLFLEYQPGDKIPLVVLRGEDEILINWTYTGFTFERLYWRLIGFWWLPYIFWLVGLASLLFIWPHDLSWRLLVLFNCLTAIWLSAGMNSASRIYESAIILRMAVWLSWPVYWHFHWVFPQVLGHLPRRLVWSVYLLSIALAVAEWYQILPDSAYFIGFLMAILGSAIFIVLHAILRPKQRRDLLPLLLAIGLILFLTLILSLTSLLGTPPYYAGGFIITLPALPASYFYAIYRHQAAGVELRANRAVAIYMYLVLVALVSFITFSVVEAIQPISGFDNFIAVVGALIASWIAIGSFGPFQRWVERRLLGMPIPPTKLIETHAEQILTAMDRDHLDSLLNNEILPSLLVRQAVLVTFDDAGCPTPVYSLQVKPDQLPLESEIPALLFSLPNDNHLSWIRLCLPLKIEGRITGAFLFGRRDPDDRYAANEIPVLQTLANQTALALKNIEQAEHLHAFYQNDVQKQEAYRTSLARELHDDVLGEMAVIAQSADESFRNPVFDKAYHMAVNRLRSVIGGLRPSTLNFGLRLALDELADNLMDMPSSKVTVNVEVPASQASLPGDVELNVFRILQQACQNAIQHGSATRICLSGLIDADCVDITVEDNGRGFETGGKLDLPNLLANHHFGLAGMFERADLIEAEIKLNSAIGSGTRLQLIWKPGPNISNL